MTDPLENVQPYASAIRKLLKGVVYYDDPAWQYIRDYELPIREYLMQLGLELHLDEIGSFAYLSDASRDEDSPVDLPALTSRRELSFVDTLLLVLLRERLDEHEMRNLDDDRLILRESDLIEMLFIFMEDNPDVRRTENSMRASIRRLQKYGFLTPYTDDTYEVRPLIRAKVSADDLDHIKRQLSEYVGTDPQDEDELNDDT
jgi:hypothetical protein